MILRVLVTALALSVPAVTLAQSQDFQISPNGCLSPGDRVLIEGRGFEASRAGDILLMDRQTRKRISVLNWSPGRATVSVPRQGLKSGQSYAVVWSMPSGAEQSVGRVTLCKTKALNPQRATRDVVAAPDGSPEYTVLVPVQQERAARAALEGQGTEFLRRRNLPQMGRVMLFYAFPQGLSLADVRALLRARASQARVDRHHIYGFSATPRLYAAAMVGDRSAQPCSLRRSVKIGVIDGPIDTGHPALRGTQIQRHSVLSSGLSPMSSDHATAIAGLIAGTGAQEHWGLATGAEILSVEAFGRDRGREGARLEDLAAGLEWLRGRKVQLVNMSMSGAQNTVFAELLARARASGMIIVAAAGNEGSKRARLPAASSDTIAVTAVDAAHRLYRKANTGAHIEFAAPGVDLWVITPRGGGYRSGTSYAAPLVTALLARYAAQGAVSFKKARQNLKARALDLGPAGRDTYFGYGLVQSGGC